MRKQIAAANWKMNLTLKEAETLVDELNNMNLSTSGEQAIILGVPFPYLSVIQHKAVSTQNMWVAAQNCSEKNNGAYTGEVSATMLQSMDIKYVILGHSERREYFGDTSKILIEKLKRAFESGLKPIFCCGEPLAIREANTHNSYVEEQLKEVLFQFSPDQLKDFIIAYEPVWAIGTGKTASTAQAQEMHDHIRTVLKNKFGEGISNSISILYGGSVKSNNAKELFGQPDVDGGLVGGASLNAAEFSTIVQALK